MAGSFEGVMKKIHGHVQASTEALGSTSLPLTASILLLLFGVILAGFGLGLLILAPVLFLLSPILVPLGTVLFLTISSLLSAGILVLALILWISWLYSYLRGMNPPGSDKVDYVRMLISDTASRVKDYAMEYVGYLQGKGRDA